MLVQRIVSTLVSSQKQDRSRTLSEIQLCIIPLIRAKQGLETERLLPPKNEMEDLFPVSRAPPLESRLIFMVKVGIFPL